MRAAVWFQKGGYRPKVEDTTRDAPTDDPDTEGPTHAVVLHNDDINGIDFVVSVVQRVFGYGLARAIALTLKAHFTGRAALWSGPKRDAEAKADEIRKCGPDPRVVEKGAEPLRVTVEAI